MDTKGYLNISMVGGLVLIVLGVILFAVTQGAFNLNWGNIWPPLIMLAGVVILVRAFRARDAGARSGMVLGGTILLLLGAFFFATTVGLISWGDQGALWPMYPLIVGVAFFAAYFASGRETSAYLVPGVILTLVAVVFLGIILSGSSYAILGRLWPIFLVIGGVLLLVMPRVALKRSSET
ncbi:MAG TPA: hypothetical protein VGE04_09695 [Chloroflexia bacterium]|jgi:drug/metabolite transporter (DMT)-like permease